MFKFLRKILKNVNKINSFVNDYKSAAKEISMPSHAYVNWGMHLIEEGKDTEALEKFEQSADMVAKTPDAFVNLGIIYAKKANFEKAILYFLKAIKIDENCAKAWSLMGSAYGEMDQKKEATRAFKRSLKLDPRSFQTHLNQGIFYAKVGEVERALASLHNAYCLNPQEPQSAFLSGILYSQGGEFKAAIQKFKLVIAVSPFHCEALYNIAFCHFHLKQFDLALNFATKARSADPNKIENFIIIAESFMNLKNRENCIRAFEEGYPIAKNSYKFFYSWGICLQAFDCWEEAISKFEQALKCQSEDYTAAHHGLSLCYLKMDIKDKAREELNKVIELSPTHTVALYNLGQLNFKEERYDEAIEAYLNAINVNAKLNHIYFNIASAYRMKGDIAKAIKYWEKNLEYDPQNVSALINLSNAYCEQGDLVAGKRKARSAYLLAKDRIEAIMAYGVLLLKCGEIFNAREIFDKALEIDPNLIGAKFAIIECMIKTNKPKEALSKLEEFEVQYAESKNFLMLKLLAYLKMFDIEQGEYLRSQILTVCDKILETHGHDLWVEEIKREYNNKQLSKDEC